MPCTQGLIEHDAIIARVKTKCNNFFQQIKTTEQLQSKHSPITLCKPSKAWGLSLFSLMLVQPYARSALCLFSLMFVLPYVRSALCSFSLMFVLPYSDSSISAWADPTVPGPPDVWRGQGRAREQDFTTTFYILLHCTKLKTAKLPLKTAKPGSVVGVPFATAF